MHAWLLLSLILLTLSACGDGRESSTATAVVVRVESDLDELAHVRVAVLDGDAQKLGDEVTWTLGEDGVELPLSFRVVPAPGAKSGSFVVRVQGLDEGGEERASLQAWARFVAGQTRTMTVRLAAVCEDVTCAEDESCRYEADDRHMGECGEILNPALTQAGREGQSGSLPVFNPPSPARAEPSGSAPDRSDASATSRADAASQTEQDGAAGQLDGGVTRDAGQADREDATAGDAQMNGCNGVNIRSLGHAADMLIVFDRSASMMLNNRWEPSKQAIKTIANEFQQVLAFGLTLFPAQTSTDPLDVLLGGSAGMCGGGEKLDVPLTLNNGAAIASALDKSPSGGLTPTASALRAALSILQAHAASSGRPANVLLMTDGAPSCDATGMANSDALEREQAIAAIRALKAANFPTYVVGYQIDPPNQAFMNALAGEGGTGNYRSVESGEQLTQTFREISKGVIDCNFAVEGLASARYVAVTLDSQTLSLNEPGGYVVSGDRVTLQGSACQTLKNGKPHQLSVQLECTVSTTVGP